MGKKNKKFGGGQKFVLLHRSQQDAEYGLEGASDLVLYRVGQRGQPQGSQTGAQEERGLLKDHVNPLGFANDGYNYEQHLRTPGGGDFVSKTGKIIKSVELPPEALASKKEENSRLLESITISEACMDADMLAAMNNPEYDNGMLDDDFVLKAAAAPSLEGGEVDQEDAFDYEAHISRLLKASETVIGATDDSDCESEVVSLDGLSESMSAVDSHQRAIIDKNFDKALKEYDSDECGPLEDPEDDPTLQGQISLDDKNMNALFDEYLVAHEKDRTFIKREAASGLESSMAGLQVRGDNIDQTESTNDVAIEHNYEAGCCDDGSSSGDEDYMPDYLKVREKPQWDCATIVSTYSNLDNHPMRLVEPKAARTKHSAASSSSRDVASRNIRDTPKRIVLSDKNGLPLGVLSSRTPTSLEAPSSSNSSMNLGVARNRTETKEDKKMRKSLVKAERQAKRQVKSDVKSTFKTKGVSDSKRRAQSTGGVSIFKY